MRCAIPMVLFACGACTGGDRGDLLAIDGSSTVYPLTEAVAEEFRGTLGARVTIGASGTGGGIKKLCRGEIAIAGASRPIQPDELDTCAAAGIAAIELPIAFDGIAVLVHPDAWWIDDITVEELRRMWAPAAQGVVMRWSDVRSGWPDAELHLFGAGVGSGTYDYFTRTIVGSEHASRGDYTASEDDNMLVQGIRHDPHALGFMGFAYWWENRASLKLIPVDDGIAENGDGAIAPSLESVTLGHYQPLSRPMFLYVSDRAAQVPAVESFVAFYLRSAPMLAGEVGYVPLSAAAYDRVRARFDERRSGSDFIGDDLLRASAALLAAR